MRQLDTLRIAQAIAVLGACPVADAVAELEEEEKAREVRRIEREERRRSSSFRLRCHGCRRWLIAANEHCHCGFNNDIRGRRNQGSYA
jgi:hypothetical protein